uniref:Lipoprotein n=1 Tax=Caenorhabditis tropicalis TaxID=1561998 RepID=A0A1I7U827_9PELO
MLIELFLLSTVFISMLVGCKKKNEASKLKPRNLDKNPSGKSPAVATPVEKKPAADGAATTSGKKEEAPVEKEGMVERPADDNETINDAKSNWGAVP